MDYTGINKVLENEDKRLYDKQQSIENAKTSKNRLISMNDNFSKRMQEYTKIIMVAIVAILLFLGTLLLKNKFPGIPDGLFTVIAIIIFSVSAIYCIMLYQKIINRDPTNFDEINPESPVVLSAQQIQNEMAAKAAKGDLTGSINLGGCVGPSCCGSEISGSSVLRKTVWDPIQQKCLAVPTAPTAAAFTTLADAISEYSKEGIPQTKAYDEWEYTQYMKI